MTVQEWLEKNKDRLEEYGTIECIDIVIRRSMINADGTVNIKSTTNLAEVAERCIKYVIVGEHPDGSKFTTLGLY